MTLKDMARDLGVAPSTISRVLNGCNKNFTIPEELRSRILEHVEKCGYRANPVFQSMKLRKNKRVAILFYSRSTMSTGYTVERMVDTSIRFLEVNGYEIDYTFNRTPRNLLKYSLPPWKVAGLLIPDCAYPESLSAIEDAKIPYVCMNGIAGACGTSVLADETDGMNQILQHLRALGHSRIAFINKNQRMKDPSLFSISRLRFLAFQKLSEKMDIVPLSVDIIVREDDTNEILGAEIDLLDGSPLMHESSDFTLRLLQHGISAVICLDDYILELLYYADKLKIRVPEQLSIVAYNDVPPLRRTTPPTTSFSVPAAEMGHLAAQILFEKLQGKPDFEQGKTHYLKGRLIVRESTAPCPT